MPNAISIGISAGEFWKMNPRIIKAYVEGFNKEQKRQFEYDNVIAHLQGMYFAEAIAATVGNMFKGKSGKKHEYPKDPYGLKDKEQQALSEDDKKKQVENLFLRLQIMQKNFEINKIEDGKV